MGVRDKEGEREKTRDKERGKEGGGRDRDVEMATDIQRYITIQMDKSRVSLRERGNERQREERTER